MGEEPGSCNDESKCRKWNEIRDLSHCLVTKFNAYTPHKDLYYVRTEKKTENPGSWAKLLYHLAEQHKEHMAQKEAKIITFMRVCIPVDRAKDAFIDPTCPMDDCTDRPADLSDPNRKCIKNLMSISQEANN